MADTTCVSEIGLLLHYPAAHLRDGGRPWVVCERESSTQSDRVPNASWILNASQNDDARCVWSCNGGPNSTYTYDFASS
jgi:hypothetical protein